MTCFDRDQASEKLWSLCNKSKNVLMLAPRRIGKTVLLNRMREEAEGKGYRAIVLDVEGFRDEKAFFQQMCSQIQEELSFGATFLTTFTDKLRQTITGTDKTGGDWRQLLLHTAWDDFAQHLLAHLDRDEKPWLILVDELPLFMLDLIDDVDGVEKANAFLYTLRRLRQKYKNVRWLYAGSIGLDTIARRHSLEGSLNDLEVYSLQPFDEPTAADFLHHVAKLNNRQFSADGVTRLIERVGWLAPYYLEKLAEDACDEGQEIITANDVDLACDSMLALEKRTYWSTWREHLDRNFHDPEKARLFSVLKLIAHDPSGKPSEDTLLAVLYQNEPAPQETLRSDLDTLLADGYLSRIERSGDSPRYAFRMTLLRDWWLRYVATAPMAGN